MWGGWRLGIVGLPNITCWTLFLVVLVYGGTITPSLLVCLPWPCFGVICSSSCASVSWLIVFSQLSLKCNSQLLMAPFAILGMEYHEGVTPLFIQVFLGGIQVILLLFEKTHCIWVSSLGNSNGYRRIPIGLFPSYSLSMISLLQWNSLLSRKYMILSRRCMVLLKIEGLVMRFEYIVIGIED